MDVRIFNTINDNWDLEAEHLHGWSIFHSKQWLQHVLDQNRSYKLFIIDAWQGCELAVRCPYFVVRKLGLVKIAASPLGGTGTNYLGPLHNPKLISGRDALALSLNTLKKHRFHHIETNSQYLEPDDFSGLGFTRHQSATNKINLPDTKEEAWKQLKSECRNRIRKAEKSPLEVESHVGATEEYAIQFSDSLKAVYKKQGLATPFGPERPRSLIERLGTNVFSVRIKLGDELVATGLFPYDRETIYFWGGASYPGHYKMCPNEIMHWHVIQFAIKQGIKTYNMCGANSRFKNKFGGKDVEFDTYSLSLLPGLAKARILYRKIHFKLLKIKGRFA